MEKGSDQTTTEWQGQFYKDETIHLGKIDRYAKEGVTFLTCCLSLFIFWLITSHVAFVISELHATEWAQLPQVIKVIPHKQLLIASTLITISSAFMSSVFKKLASTKTDFVLIKLFSKNAAKKPSHAPRGFDYD